MRCVRGSHGGRDEGHSTNSRPEVTLVVPVPMLRNLTKTSPMLLQEPKQAEVSKL